MTVKDCGGHKGWGWGWGRGCGCECGCGCGCKRKKLYLKLLVALVLLLPFVVLVVWLVLRPHKPTFYLQNLSVFGQNVTPPASAYLFTNMTVTIAARNNNDRIGVYYDKLDVYAQYKDVPITEATLLPVEYQDNNDQSVWSPSLLSCDNFQLPPYLAVALAQDETAGYVQIDIRVDGWIRWKVGTWISGHYHLRVNCPVLLTVNDGKGSYGANTGGAYGCFHCQQAVACSVDV